MDARVRTIGAVALALLAADTRAAAPPPRVVLDLRAFQVVEGPSAGPAVYYQVVNDEKDGLLLRGSYRPGMESVALGTAIPEAFRKRARVLRWRWRIREFPVGGNECKPGYGDSAASMVAAFKRGLKWYILKYVWSPVAPLGAVCDGKRSLLLARDTIVLESGGSPGVWLSEVVDVHRSFIDHFEGGNPDADVPDLVGVSVMTDGDQTRSAAGADWADIEIQ